MAEYNELNELLFFEQRGRDRDKKIDMNFMLSYWKGQLFERILRLFVYEGWLPYPQRQLEKRVLRAGVCAEVNDKYVGLMATYGSLTGITEYYDMFKYVVYANPVAKGGTLTIGKNAVVLLNNSTMLSINPFIDYYSSLLAHASITARIALINARAQDILLASSESTRDTINEWYDLLYDGKPMSILDKTLFSPSESVFNAANTNDIDVVAPINAINEIIRNFYRDIGVRYAKDKRSNTITDEVTSDSQMLLFNIDDMLECRKEFCYEHNRVFESRFDEINSKSIWGYKYDKFEPLTVKLNPIFELITDGEGNDYEQENNIE